MFSIARSLGKKRHFLAFAPKHYGLGWTALVSQSLHGFSVLLSLTALSHSLWTAKVLEAPLATGACMFAAVSSSFSIWCLASKRKLRRDGESTHLQGGTSSSQIIIEGVFDQWKLSSVEREITWLLIRGFSNSEIAKVRGTSESTIKTQLRSVFKKSNVETRSQVVSLLFDEVIYEDLQRSSTPPAMAAQ